MSDAKRQAWLDRHRTWTCTTCSAVSRKPIDKSVNHPAECKGQPRERIAHRWNPVLVGCDDPAPIVIVYKRVFVERIAVGITVCLFSILAGYVAYLINGNPEMAGLGLVIPGLFLGFWALGNIPLVTAFTDENSIPPDAISPFSWKMYCRQGMIFAIIAVLFAVGSILLILFRILTRQ